MMSLMHGFRSIKQWKGPLPEDMLAKLWTPGLMHERAMPDMQCEVGLFSMLSNSMSRTVPTLQFLPVEIQGASTRATIGQGRWLTHLQCKALSCADSGDTARQGACGHSGLPATGQCY